MTGSARYALTRLAAMRGRTRLAGPAVTLALAAAGAGCGGEDGGAQIPPDSADAMLETAQRIEDAVTERSCETAQGLTTELRGQVEALPEETDPEIVDALDQMVSRLDEQLDGECVEEGTTDTEEEPTTEPTETTVAPEPTTSVPTETTTTTEPPPEEEEEEAPPPDSSGPGGGEGPPVTPPAGGGEPTGGTEGDD